jgi:excisionase family DNA binding protein
MQTSKKKIADKVQAALLHSVPETRQLLGNISHTTFYDLLRDGRLKAVKIGSRTFVSDDALRAFIRTCSAYQAGA